MIPARTIRRLAWIFCAVLLAGCVGAPAIISPASTSARAITDLMWVVFGASAFVFVAIEGLLLYAVFKFRHAGEVVQAHDLPVQTEGNQPLEIIWTVIPAVGLLAIFVISVLTLRSIVYIPAPTASTPKVVNIRAVGHQWWWEFDYPDFNIVSANEFHAPLNTVLYITVESADVIHSFWVPQMGGKIDAIPGHSNQIWFEPTEIGVFTGECSEFCGAEHSNMRMDLVVQSSDDFQVWVKQQQAPVPVLTGDAQAGEQLFLASACVSCHAVDGTKAKGKIGPNLTHFGSRLSLGAKVATNTPENLANWLVNPSALKPGVLMPSLGLSADKIKALVAYLTSLK